MPIIAILIETGLGLMTFLGQLVWTTWTAAEKSSKNIRDPRSQPSSSIIRIVQCGKEAEHRLEMRYMILIWAITPTVFLLFARWYYSVKAHITAEIELGLYSFQSQSQIVCQTKR
jgi:hypothetical protein